MHEKIQEASNGKFLGNAESLFPLPSSGGYDRLHKSWRKTVVGLNKAKTDGYSLIGEFLKDGPAWFAPGLYLACAWRGSVKNQKPYYALYKLTVSGEIETLADIDPGRDWAIKLWPVIEAALAPAPGPETASTSLPNFTTALANYGQPIDRLAALEEIALLVDAIMSHSDFHSLRYDDSVDVASCQIEHLMTMLGYYGSDGETSPELVARQQARMAELNAAAVATDERRRAQASL